MNELVVYQPQTVIVTYDENMYFTTAPIAEIQHAMGNLKALSVNGEVIAVSTIKRVYTDKYGVASLTREQLERLEARKKNFKYNTGRSASPEAVQNMIRRIQSETL